VGNPYSNSNSYQFTGSALGSFQAPCSAAAGAPVCALINLTTTPDASVSASLSAYNGQTSSLIAEVAYYYEIVIPGSPAQSNTPGNTLIPLVVSGYASFTDSIGPRTSIGGQQLNFASITVAGQTASGGTVGTTASSSATVGPSPFQVQVNAFSYTPNAVSLKTFETIVNNGDDVPGTVTAFVDPIVSFAPGFDSTGYSIVVSSGIANGAPLTAAPEPASFTLAAFALVGVVLLGRRKRSLRLPAGESSTQPGMRKA
jgi:hypothetical protein